MFQLTGPESAIQRYAAGMGVGLAAGGLVRRAALQSSIADQCQNGQGKPSGKSKQHSFKRIAAISSICSVSALVSVGISR